MKAYIAAPFFNPHQIETVENIKKLLKEIGVAYFSPKDECMFEKGVTTAEEILKINVDAMEACTFIIANTDNKDMGTLFECGYAYARNMDIIYYWKNDNPELKFNLMLAGSGYGVAQNFGQLEDLIVSLETRIPKRLFEGEME